MNAVIKAENLGKKYIIGHQRQPRYQTLRDTMTHTARGVWQRIRHPLSPNRESVDLEELWALKDINFEVQQGDRVGIIGANGAGKSTLLKVLSRITEPTTGKVRIKGRVSSLLEVGTGFHPELTGRENIFLNGAILGMTRQEVKRKFDEIVAFAELEKFLDTPVKRYSSGMYVRLAFAVAAHLEPEILIVDEVLAVGDAAFQKKCLSKMENVAGEGRTVLFVSHNMGAIRSLCSKSVLLQQGQLIIHDGTDRVIDYYIRDNVSQESCAAVELRDHLSRLAGMVPVLTRLTIRDSSLRPSSVFTQSETIIIEIEYDARLLTQPIAGAGFLLESTNGVRVGGFNTYMERAIPPKLPAYGRIRFCLEAPVLNPGRYYLTVSIGSHQHHLVDKVEHALAFDVSVKDIYETGYLPNPKLGVVALRCKTSIKEYDNVDLKR